jgi:Holliday junction DNA helicase RuvB
LENDKLMRSQYDDEEDSKEAGLRPKFLEEFQGQKTIKENLSIFIRAARERGESIDHVFISGPPGLGKTTLAGIIAAEMGAEFKVTSAPALDKPKDLAGILTTMGAGAVFFIDEIHRLKPVLEEMLYIAMEDFQIDWVIGQGPSAHTVRIPIKPFTLIGATTKAGLVASPLYSRFGINIRFNYYSPEELIKIVYRSADILGIKIRDDAAQLLSGCSRGTPRIANRLLRRMRDFAQVFSDGVITKKVVADGLGRLAIDSYGLESHDREILKTIIQKYGGGPVGADTLAISVGESNDTLEDFYEPYLIQRGFLQRTPRGRIATPLAYEHLNLIPKNADNENQGLLF